MASSVVASGLGSSLARLACLATDAHSSSSGMEDRFSSACGLRSPVGLGSAASGFAGGARRVCVESPRSFSSRRDGTSFQARARTATCDETEEKVESPSTQTSRIGGEPTLYDILGLTENVGVKEIKSAFRQLARRFHPDVNAEEQREECTQDFMKIHAAYTTLSDPQSKAAYDLQLSMQRFQRNGYAGSRITPLSQSWDFPTAPEKSSPAQNWDISWSTGYSAPSSFNSQWKGRSWETDQCW
ncbi:hypothetical protein MPTK1_2g20430 [Marchantia polymorpha subsp. ruderalis]|uniref:J domain-containing protein n=1 Tax=Marchantia polymorpha TaxID=3197 RepID=A0A2R6WV38_MARPO|nr:hypothetical protein MARPO_0055s0006 [Marchantia polymorpha]BBN03068.1 hypothetical protein Mp_2g20430 [Marchantia polymorpha subsp. ruderalis]|eukprot:PTQ37717.1 hypothetical protein MARPO_0055s0006 [Marchantia polymorpha]